MANNKAKATSPMSGLPMKILAIALAALLVFGIAWSVVENSGMMLKGTVSLSSEHYTVDNAMLSYYYQTEYSNFVSQYSYYLSYFGLDTSKPLKSQKYSDTQTWFQYFMDTAIENVKEQLLLCEAALAAGKSIGEKEQEQIDEALAALKETAKTYNMTVSQYVSGIYGTGVTLNDIEKCLEISALAATQYQDLYDSYVWTEEDFDKWVEEDDENRAKIWFVDYMSYSFEAEFKKDDDDETKSEARQAAEKLAKELAEKKTKDEFYDWVATYEESLKKDEDKDDDKEEDNKDDKEEEKTEEEKKEEEEKKRQEAMDKITTEDYGYDTESDIGKWAFDKDRVANDTTVIYDKDEETYTAYILLAPKYRDEYASVDVRHILIEVSSSAKDEELAEAKKKAEEILAEYKKGEMTADKFGELAKKYTADGNGDEGGLYENVCKDDMVAEFNDWIFDESRKEGDTDIVKTSYGYHVMYYQGTGLLAWQVTADSGLNADQYEKDYETMEKTYKVEVNTENAYKIDG